MSGDDVGTDRAGAGDWLRAVVLRSAVLALAWLAVTEADPGALTYAPVAVAVAVAVSLVVTGGPGRGTSAPRRVAQRAGRALSLVGWVLARSVVGGVDVARRTLSLPRADIDPSWTTYRCSLPTETSRIVFAFVLNLMPGTLTANLHGTGGDLLDVHAISPEVDVVRSAAELERRIGALLRP